MLYVDTIILVAALTNKARTAQMQDWLADQPAGDLAVSDTDRFHAGALLPLN